MSKLTMPVWWTARHLVVVFAVLTVGSILAASVSAAVSPPTVDETLDPGESITITKNVETPTIPANPDIVFLADSTGSMGAAIANVKANAATILSTISGFQPTAQFAVADYKDITDPYRLNIGQVLTSDTTSVLTAINLWAASGGADWPEAQIPALYDLANGAAGTWRTDSSRIIVWFGDAYGHDPSDGVSMAQAITALQSETVRVVAVDVGTVSSGLDATGQATAITTATLGSLLTTSDDVSGAILAGIASLPITVTTSVDAGCVLNISFSPTSVTVNPGDDAVFDETIAVPAGTPGGTYTCTVEFFSDGASLGTQVVTITVPGDDPPAGGGEGCTPGFWGNHTGAWVGYETDDDYADTFGVSASFDSTLLEAAGQGGGGEMALGRHAVAALLNASSLEVSYDLSTAGVIAMVQDAYGTGDFETAKDTLEAFNEQGCPTNGKPEGEKGKPEGSGGKGRGR